jgi:HAD superfamily hydrolase (TIGR01662 family)
MAHELVLILGMQGSGKSTVVEDYVKRGYTRFNRDDAGGSLDTLHARLEGQLKIKPQNCVLDNTYANKASRKPVIDIAKRHGMTIRAIVMDTEFADCQYNVCTRMVRKLGKFPTTEELKEHNKRDPSFVPAVVQYVYRKEYQAPDKSEGFAAVESVPFVRVYDPAYNGKALILDYDDCLRICTAGNNAAKGKFPCHPDEIKILPNRTEVLKKYLAAGYKLCGVSNQSGVAKGLLSEETAHACFKRTNELLGVQIDYAFCPHRVPPITCFCRKPGPGLGVHFIEKYKLDPRQCIFVGDMGTDKSFAARCGFKFVDAAVFFDKGFKHAGT